MIERIRAIKFKYQKSKEGFPGGSVVKNPPANAGDMGLIPDHMPWNNQVPEP